MVQYSRAAFDASFAALSDATENGPVSIGVAREGAILQMTNGRLR